MDDLYAWALLVAALVTTLRPAANPPVLQIVVQ
jgi:hypothetical protein